MNLITTLFLSLMATTAWSQKGFSLVEKNDQKKIEVQYNGTLLTAYCYFDSTEKPVLFPVKTVTGITVTRGFPIAPRMGERTDHPHHVGLWFNYEDVNGLDFWNNSYAIPPEKKHRYGSVRHQEVLLAKASNDLAELKTLSHWVDSKGTVLLEEVTHFIFSVTKNDFIIDRSSTLKAMTPEVVFKDVKDGLLGLRVARELEQPSKEKHTYVDASGNVTTVPDINNEGVTGVYINKEGIKGDDVWSSRSAWACLSGKKNNETIAVVILDHPKNTGYPTYWHARGYGLFAANPLGQKVFSNGKEELNLKLLQGQTTTFKFRVVIHSGSNLQPVDIDVLAQVFGRR